jgi:hypothetical protein
MAYSGLGKEISEEKNCPTFRTEALIVVHFYR